ASFCFAQPQATASPSPAPKPKMSKAAMLKKLSAMETKLWEAWKNKDVKPFNAWLASDSVMVGDMGLGSKKDIAEEIKQCDVKSYKLSDWKLSMLNSGAALLTYKGSAEGTCGGQAIPTVWASSVWVNRGGKWLAGYHSEIPAK